MNGIRAGFPKRGTPAVNSGTGDADADGTAADLRIYGGSDGDHCDRENDYFPDYFWPGTFDDRQARGVTAVHWDQDTGDPEVR